MKMYMNIVLFVLFHFEMLYAQQSYLFNKIYQPDTALLGSIAILPFNNHYWTLGGYINYENLPDAYAEVGLHKISLSGETLDFKLVDTGFAYRHNFFGASLQKDHEGNMVMVFTKGATPISHNFVLVKTDSMGNILFKQEYERENMQDYPNLVICAEADFLVIGISQQYPTPTTVGPARIHAIKTDNYGEVIWEYIYPSGNTWPLYASQTPDGGFIISGYQYNTATGYDMYALKIDAQGAVEWEKTYGTPVDDGGCNVQSYPLGGYFLNGLKWLGTNTVAHYGAWLDDAGNVMYSKTISKNERFGIQANPIFFDDGSYKSTTLTYGPSPLWEVAFTTFNNLGEIVSEVPISSGLPGEDYIRDLEPTPDGGYILAGFNYIPGFGANAGWVVKLGPNGEYCGAAPCLDSLFVTAITPPRFEGGQGGEPPTHATVYPNPVPAGSSTAQLS
ncbi:MAG TPA: hypothetical protein PK715_14500, partial [Chitinophagales bacterium]|nr:hypothetical protein [Chitinophagales bacterium]